MNCKGEKEVHCRLVLDERKLAGLQLTVAVGRDHVSVRPSSKGISHVHCICDLVEANTVEPLLVLWAPWRPG